MYAVLNVHLSIIKNSKGVVQRNLIWINQILFLKSVSIKRYLDCHANYFYVANIDILFSLYSEENEGKYGHASSESAKSAAGPATSTETTKYTPARQ